MLVKIVDQWINPDQVITVHQEEENKGTVNFNSNSVVLVNVSMDEVVNILNGTEPRESVKYNPVVRYVTNKGKVFYCLAEDVPKKYQHQIKGQE